jgi:hypothetical protein
MLNRLLNLCEIIGPMAIRPSDVHIYKYLLSCLNTCVQSHPLSNFLIKCDEIYLTVYQLSCPNGFGCNRGYESPKHRFWKKAMFKDPSHLEPKAFKSNHDHGVISNASLLKLRLFCHNWIKSRFFYFRHPV